MDPSLFSLEVAVESLFVKPAVVCYVPSFGFRLLDYPTISVSLLNDNELKKVRDIIKETSPSSTQYQIPQLQRRTGTYFFNRAKSCLFKNNLERFVHQMSTTPLYVMLLDVVNKDATKLIGTAAISLEKTIQRLHKNVNKAGTIEAASTSGEKDIYPLYNLMGNKIGEVTLGIRVTSLGKNLLQHIAPSEKEYVNDENIKPYTKNEIFNTLKKENSKQSSNEISNKENVNSEAQTNYQDFSANKEIQFPQPGNNEDEFYPPAMYYEKEQTKQETKQADKKESDEKVITPRKGPKQPEKVIYPSKYSSTKVDTTSTQTEPLAVVSPEVSALNQFPVLQALMKEISNLGNFQNSEMNVVQGPSPEVPKLTDKPKTPKLSHQKQRKPFLTGRYKQPKPSPHTGPLRFGMTNTTKLRIRQVKDAKILEEQSRNEIFVTQSSTPLQATYVKKKKLPRKGKLVSKAVGPNESQLRRSVSRSQDIRAQTVFMEQLLSKHPALTAKHEEATDVDVRPLSSESHSQDHSSRSTGNKEDAYTTSVSPRAVSRQSQRSIEIRLPTASTDLPSEKDYTEDWTASSVGESHDKLRILQSYDSNISVTAPSDYSEKYSDDFDDERTGSPDRTSIKSSRSFDASTNIQDSTDDKPFSSVNLQSSTDVEDDFKLQVYNMSDLPSPLQNPTSQESDSSVSRGNSSVVTALIAQESPKVSKKMAFPLPEPIPSDSPVIQSMATTTTNGSTTGSVDPIKLPQTLEKVTKTKSKPTKTKEDIKLPKATKHKVNSPKQYKRPSPPSTRKSSPMSSIDSDRYRGKYSHPGRRTRRSSSSSDMISPEPYQRPSSLMKSESVSSYQPSDIPSDLSDLRMSEDIGNLSDIQSEENSQKYYK